MYRKVKCIAYRKEKCKFRKLCRKIKCIGKESWGEGKWKGKCVRRGRKVYRKGKCVGRERKVCIGKENNMFRKGKCIGKESL